MSLLNHCLRVSGGQNNKNTRNELTVVMTMAMVMITYDHHSGLWWEGAGSQMVPDFWDKKNQTVQKGGRRGK